MTARISARSAFNAAVLPINIARVRLRAYGSAAIILHNGRFKSIPPGLLIPLFCSAERGRLSKPANLTILLVHNRPTKTLLEQNLEYLGITDYTLIRLPPEMPWRHTARITVILDYVRSGRCSTDYILCCDCDDVLVRDDLAKAVELLRLSDCEMLVSSTAYAVYHGMPDVKKLTISMAPEPLLNDAGARIHINAGVFIARTSFLKEYLNEAQRYVGQHDLSIALLNTTGDEALLKMLPDFPLGVGSDQTIMRYLFPRFHPRMQIDYAGKLALR